MDNVKYFLAANSAEGFISEFDGCYEPNLGWKAYIIKGGPGTGKSSFMRSVIKKAEEKGTEVEEVYCTGDPDSLDAVVLPTLKKIIMDGTAPHVVDPKLPGVSDKILNFGEFWDRCKLSIYENEISRLNFQNKQLHFVAAKYIKAAGEILSANLKMAENCINRKELCKPKAAFYPKKMNCRTDYSEAVRYIKGVTLKGVLSFADTLKFKAKRVILINDRWGKASTDIINSVRQSAMLNGDGIIVYKNPILPSKLVDAVFVPSEGLLVLRNFGDIDFQNAEKIDANCFYKGNEDWLSENDEAFKLLISSASKNLAEAKAVHDEIEKYYINAMDFEALKKYCDSVLDEIFE